VLNHFAFVRAQLRDVERECALKDATIRRLNERLHQLEHRAALAETAAREVVARAYRFAAAGWRR
jgi:hypothetical protein